MSSYTGLQRFLIRDADNYINLGYKVGYAKGKEYLGEGKKVTKTVMTMFGPYVSNTDVELPEGFDGISLIPENMVCIDIDINDLGVVWEGMPPTLKERTPRGWHLFYRLPNPHKGQCKIKWREHVDLLCVPGAGVPPKKKRSSAYGGMKEDGSPWGEHILISGTPGYKRIWPDEIPPFDKLPEAPLWLIDAVEK